MSAREIARIRHVRMPRYNRAPCFFMVTIDNFLRLQDRVTNFKVMLGGGADRLCTPSTSAGPFRIFAVAGFQNRANDIVYCPPIIRQTTQNVEDSTAIVYFGGDVQDFPESMETNRDSRGYMKYNLENSAILLREAFPHSHIIVIRPVRMEFKTFSCFDNFVRGNNAGVPDHTPMNHALQHLEKLLQNLSHRLISIPENEILDQAAQAEAAAAAVAAAAAAAALTLSTANAQVENNAAAHNAAKAAAAAAAAALLANNSAAATATQPIANNNNTTASIHNSSINNNGNDNSNTNTNNSNNSNDCHQDMDIDILQVQENVTLSTDGAVIFPTAAELTNDHINEALIAASTDIDSKMDITPAEDKTPTDIDTTNACTEATTNPINSNINNTSNNLLLTPAGADDEQSQTNNLVADLTNTSSTMANSTSTTSSSTSTTAATTTTTATTMPVTRMLSSSPPPLTPISSTFLPRSNNVNAMEQESSETTQPQKSQEQQQTQENGNPLWWRENLNLDKSKLILIGFSKGCVVLNQFIYEFHYLKTLTPDDSTMVRLLSRIKDMYWLDGGHGGQKNTWITSRSLLETLTRMEINVHVHLTPYQVQDDRRPWIRKEEKIFSDMLKRLGASLTRHLHYDNQTPNLMTHFEVLQAFCEHVHNIQQQPHNNSEQTASSPKQQQLQQHNNDMNNINRSTSPTAAATTNDNSLNDSEK